MLKAVALSTLLVFATPAEAGIGNDKAIHFVACAGTSLLVGQIAAENGAKHPKLWGFCAGMALGLAKETYDSRPGGTGFSGADLAADALGSSVCFTIQFGRGTRTRTTWEAK